MAVAFTFLGCYLESQRDFVSRLILGSTRATMGLTGDMRILTNPLMVTSDIGGAGL